MSQSHYSHKRKHSRENRRRARLRAIAYVVGIVVLAGISFAVASLGAGGAKHRGDLSYLPPDDWNPEEVALETIATGPAKDAYPYSVIPGGVRSPVEFAAARAHDPVVAQHYNDVSAASLRVERVDEPTSAYMSYRIGDRVYWTKNKLPLHEGETILTDGDTTIRGRCGNRVSETAMLPISDAEPTAEAFERTDYPSAPVVAGVLDANGMRASEEALNGLVGGGTPSNSQQLVARNDLAPGPGSGGVGGVGGGSGIGGGLGSNTSSARNGRESSTPILGSTPGGGASDNPGDGSNNPGGGSNSPGVGSNNNPGGGSNNPGGGSNNPGGGSSNPGGGSSNPGGGSNNPGGGSNNPGGGSNTPDGDVGLIPGGDDPFGPEGPPDENTPGVTENPTPEAPGDPLSVPEPASMLLLAGGAAGLALRRRLSARRRVETD